jgi:hypothetical protein
MSRDVVGRLADDDSLPVVLMHDGHREPGQLARRIDTSNTCGLARPLLGDGGHQFTVLPGGVAAGLREGPS